MMAGKSATSNRGFASMDEDKQREIARKGGESVPDEKRSFRKTMSWLPRLGGREAKASPTKSAASRRIMNLLRRRDVRGAKLPAAIFLGIGSARRKPGAAVAKPRMAKGEARAREDKIPPGPCHRLHDFT